MATEWTDEKHSLYLKSMEASFVSQLYSRSQEDFSSNPKSNPSGQFKVLRGGCWQTVSHRRTDLPVKKSDGSQNILANPWIRHFRAGSKHQSVISSKLQEKAVLPANHTSTCREDLVEMSGQNFVDEEVREKPSRKSNIKRIKTEKVAAENFVSPKK
jgi:hypothetical protein